MPLDIAALGYPAALVSFTNSAQNIVGAWVSQIKPLSEAVRRMSPEKCMLSYFSGIAAAMLLYGISGSVFAIIASIIIAGGLFSLFYIKTREAGYFHAGQDQTSRESMNTFIGSVENLGESIGTMAISATGSVLLIPAAIVSGYLVYFSARKHFDDKKGPRPSEGP